MVPPSQIFFALSFLLDFSETVRNTFPSLGKLSRMNTLLFKKIHFRKPLFYPTTTYSWLCSSEHTYMKNLIATGF